jgi:hypothetical protein
MVTDGDSTMKLEEASENIAAISILCQRKALSCDKKGFVRSDDSLATHYSFEPATALLAVRNTQKEEVEDEEEEKEEGGQEAAREQDTSTKVHGTTRQQSIAKTPAK